MNALAEQGKGVWTLAFNRFLADRVGVTSAVLVVLGLLLVLASLLGLVASQWSAEVAIGHAPPHWFKKQPSEPIGGATSRSGLDKAALSNKQQANTPTLTDVVDPIES